MKAIVNCIAVALTFCFASAVYSQASVCVVDVASVFSDYTAFNSELENLKQEAEQFKTQLQNQAMELQKMAEELRTLDVNSDAYRELESRIARINADLEVKRRNKTREFVQREANLHFQTYVAATQAVSNICDERGIALVLQYLTLIRI